MQTIGYYVTTSTTIPLWLVWASIKELQDSGYYPVITAADNLVYWDKRRA